jgi:hypothetical protein
VDEEGYSPASIATLGPNVATNFALGESFPGDEFDCVEHPPVSTTIAVNGVHDDSTIAADLGNLVFELSLGHFDSGRSHFVPLHLFGIGNEGFGRWSRHPDEHGTTSGALSWCLERGDELVAWVGFEVLLEGGRKISTAGGDRE